MLGERWRVRSRIRASVAVTKSAFFAALLVILALASPALAREEIRSFVSSTILNLDGAVDVTETIAVNAEGDQIRHGIFRDIPTALINPDNSRVRSDLKVLSVTRDGNPEPYTLDGLGTGFKRIKIGAADVLLDDGVHTYVIHYTMTRMGRSLPDHDELYWNATGNYWAFPIMSAVANVTLPPGAVVSNTIVFTGPPGSQEHAATATRNANGGVTFRSTRELSPGEGMTVAVSFQKGLLATPQGLDAAGYWLSDHRELVFPSIAVLILLLYNILAWSAVGRDPRKGTIIPLFHPPQDLSPAMVHYVADMGFKKSGWTAFTASIFDLGVKGLVKIDKAGGATNITAIGARADNLPLGEQSVYDYLHAKGQVTIDKTDGPRLNEKRGELVKEILDKNREVYFKNNVPYTLGGVALAAVLLGALVWLDVLEPIVLIVALVVAIFIGVFVGVAAAGGGGRGVYSRVFGLIWIGVLAVNIFGSSISLGSGLHIDMGLVGAISIFLVEIVFAVLMRAPTVAGRTLMDQIAGFKMYLETAEKSRLNYVDKGEPPMTVPRFESILPFAIALGVEKLWSQRFQGDLARNAVQGVQNGAYVPLWYSGGTNWSDASTSIANTVSSLSSSLTSAMIAAQPSSSAGSGFSGGGSGGGGGGGGGGGW